jgi:hypothetical protein
VAIGLRLGSRSTSRWSPDWPIHIKKTGARLRSIKKSHRWTTGRHEGSLAKASTPATLQSRSEVLPPSRNAIHAVDCLSRSLGSDQSRHLRGENCRERAHRFPLFAAVLQLDGENTHTP